MLRGFLARALGGRRDSIVNVVRRIAGLFREPRIGRGSGRIVALARGEVLAVFGIRARFEFTGAGEFLGPFLRGDGEVSRLGRKSTAPT